MILKNDTKKWAKNKKSFGRLATSNVDRPTPPSHTHAALLTDMRAGAPGQETLYGTTDAEVAKQNLHPVHGCGVALPWSRG